MTLLELLVAAGLLALLSAAVFLVFRTGTSAWQKGQTQTDLIQQLQLVTSALARDVEAAPYDSLSLSPGGDGISVLSALYADGNYALNTHSGELVWQSFIVYYLSQGQVLRRRVPLAVPAAVSGPVEATATNLGTHSIDFYRSGGKSLTQDVSRLQFGISGQMLVVEIEGRKKRYGSEAPEVFRLSTTVRLRN